MILSTQQILNRNNDLLKEKNSTSLKIDGDKVIRFIAWAQIAVKTNAELREAVEDFAEHADAEGTKVDCLKLISNDPRAHAALI